MLRRSTFNTGRSFSLPGRQSCWQGHCGAQRVSCQDFLTEGPLSGTQCKPPSHAARSLCHTQSQPQPCSHHTRDGRLSSSHILKMASSLPLGIMNAQRAWSPHPSLLCSIGLTHLFAQRGWPLVRRYPVHVNRTQHFTRHDPFRRRMGAAAACNHEVVL